jgi:hypothetical protein
MLKEIKLIQIWLGTKFYEFEDLLVRKGKSNWAKCQRSGPMKQTKRTLMGTSAHNLTFESRIANTKVFFRATRNSTNGTTRQLN